MRVIHQLFLLALSLLPATAQAQVHSTTELQLHYGDGFHLGRNGSDTTTRTVITLEHFTAFEYGDVFFFIDNRYDYDGLNTSNKSGQYGEIYGHLSGRALGWKFPDGGLVKDVALGIGINQGDNLTIGLVGPRVSFNVPGFSLLSLGVYAYDTINDPQNRDLDTTYQATLTWNAPFELGNQKFTFKGFADFIGDRGVGVDNRIVFSPQLRWDVGYAMGKKPGWFNVGLEYTHDKNKFGVPGVDDNSLTVFAAIKLH